MTVARDGFEAVDRALQIHPDIIIMDLAMPGLDGFETTQRLKAPDSTRDIPVIALTAHGELPAEWALTAGCAAYQEAVLSPRPGPGDLGRPRQGGRLPAPAHPSPAPSEHLHALVVDGSVGDRELLAEYLEYRGCVRVRQPLRGRCLGDAQRLGPR